jgi:hypothetical protein
MLEIREGKPQNEGSLDFENVQKARTRGYNRTKEPPNTGF